MAVRFADARAVAAAGFSPTAGPSVGLAAAVSAAAVVAAAVITPGGAEHGAVLCPFRLATGLPCPGCGLTRSWVHLMHGQLGDAVAANLFGPVALVLAVGLVVVTAFAVVRRRPLPTYAELVGPRGSARRAGLAFVVAGWILFGAVRLVVVALS